MDVGVTELIKAVADLGFTIVVSAIFIWLALKGFNNQQKWMEKFINSKLDEFKVHPSHEDVETLDLVNSEMNKELRGLLNALSADRTTVYLYHNGGVSSSGLYFQKMSCVCEVVSQGILPFSSQEQGLHRASYSLLCDNLKSSKYYKFDDVEEMKGTDNFLYQHFIQHHTDSAYFYALLDSNEVIGFIGVEYCSLNEDIPDETIELFMTEASLRISSLVSIREKIQDNKEGEQ